MGTDITIEAQRREDGEWVRVSGSFSQGPDPFDWRSYGLFAFLAGIRNYSAITPIAAARGAPCDLTSDEYWQNRDSVSWLTFEELALYDYDQIIEDRRSRGNDGSKTVEPGAGVRPSLRDFLGQAYFDDLKELARIGAERIVFAFDS